MIFEKEKWYAYTALLFKHTGMEHSGDKKKYLEHNFSGRQCYIC